MRACPECGTPEERKQDSSGMDLVNLDPFTGLCLDCLVRRVRNGWLTWPKPEGPRDFARAAANDRSE